MSGHTVRLPHPHREGYTVGECTCGWNVPYRWGEHGDAAHDARQHIEGATQSEPVEGTEMSGERIIWPGRSL